MIATLACFIALADNKQTLGQKWHYTLTWHFYSQDIDMTDEESFDIEVSKVLPDSTSLKISQKLTASIVDNQRFPTDPKAAPTSKEWALSPTGSVAYMPNARFPLESRVFRILRSILPAPKGDLPRNENWKLDFEDDGLGMTQSKLQAWYVKTMKDSKEFAVSYLEKNGTNGAGRFVRTEKIPFPSLLEIKFTNTKMSGGTDIVDCDLVMKLKEDK
jgi:hypothetical protein